MAEDKELLVRGLSAIALQGGARCDLFEGTP